MRCYLSVQFVTVHHYETSHRVDGEQISRRQERVADLSVEGAGLVLIGGLHAAHYLSCGDGDQNGLG